MARSYVLYIYIPLLKRTKVTRVSQELYDEVRKYATPSIGVEDGLKMTTVAEVIIKETPEVRRIKKRHESITVFCDFCSNRLERTPSKHSGQERFFCNRSCKSEFYRRTEVRYKIHHNRRNRASTATIVNCSFCGKKIKRYQAKLERNIFNFCSRDCKSKFYQETKVKYMRVGGRNIELRQKIRQMRTEKPGATLLEIGKECGVSRERVRQILSEYNLPTRAAKIGVPNWF